MPALTGTRVPEREARAMIRNSFVFIPKIGKKTEAGLWKRNILDWSDLARELPAVFKEPRRQDSVRNHLAEAEAAFAGRDIAFFARCLPEPEHWRLYPAFRQRTVFLDIETTGLSPYYDKITVIGTHDGNYTHIFVRDTNMDEFAAFLAKFAIVVTFNGKLFDVPFIRKVFRDIAIPPVHIDLRFLLKSVGFSGPLKQIERTLGVVREECVRDIDGRQAVVLWNRFLRGDDAALRDLVRYNVADTVGLKKLMDFCYLKKLEKDCLPLMQNEVVREMIAGPVEAEFDGNFFTGTAAPFPEITVQRRPGGLALLCDGVDLLSVKRNEIHRPGVALPSLLARIPVSGRAPVSMGIDLTGSAVRASGICILRGGDAHLDAHLSLLHADEEILTAACEAQPDIIAIDSSLSLPRGRCCASDSCACRQHGIMRECERELKRRGISVYPTLIPSMQEMTVRGIALATALRGAGFTVIESYPGAVQDILGFPRKQVHLGELKTDLMSIGIVPHVDREAVTHHEIDAMTNAVAGIFYLAGLYEAIGDPEEGLLIIPRPEETGP